MSKTVNYTAENEARMVEVYGAAESDEARAEAVMTLAGELAKPKRSVIAKLSRMGVYVKPERKTKTGEKVERKDRIATEIGEALGLSEADTDSLAKANAKALKAIRAAISD
jgi:response regulator RpfG family c-di-GMP phosphodiesterase